MNDKSISYNNMQALRPVDKGKIPPLVDPPSVDVGDLNYVYNDGVVNDKSFPNNSTNSTGIVAPPPNEIHRILLERYEKHKLRVGGSYDRDREKIESILKKGPKQQRRQLLNLRKQWKDDILHSRFICEANGTEDDGIITQEELFKSTYEINTDESIPFVAEYYFERGFLADYDLYVYFRFLDYIPLINKALVTAGLPEFGLEIIGYLENLCQYESVNYKGRSLEMWSNALIAFEKYINTESGMNQLYDSVNGKISWRFFALMVSSVKELVYDRTLSNKNIAELLRIKGCASNTIEQYLKQPVKEDEKFAIDFFKQFFPVIE